MKRYLMRLIFPLSIVSGTVVSFSGDAIADAKIYLGTLCVEQSDSSPEIMYNGVNATNTAGGYNVWSCPVVRDVADGDITAWHVAYDRNGNTTDAWTITLLSCDASGSTCFTDPQVLSFTDGPQEIDGDAVNNFDDYGGVTIETSVPPDCEIYSYGINES